MLRQKQDTAAMTGARCTPIPVSRSRAAGTKRVPHAPADGTALGIWPSGCAPALECSWLTTDCWANGTFVGGEGVKPGKRTEHKKCPAEPGEVEGRWAWGSRKGLDDREPDRSIDLAQLERTLRASIVLMK